MQITKRDGDYFTEDDQSFKTYGEAIGHAKRLAIAHYLQVIRHKLHEDVGPISKDSLIFIRQIGDGIDEIIEEKPYLHYAEGRKRLQSPLRRQAA